VRSPVPCGDSAVCATGLHKSAQRASARRVSVLQASAESVLQAYTSRLSERRRGEHRCCRHRRSGRWHSCCRRGWRLRSELHGSGSGSGGEAEDGRLGSSQLGEGCDVRRLVAFQALPVKRQQILPCHDLRPVVGLRPLGHCRLTFADAGNIFTTPPTATTQRRLLCLPSIIKHAALLPSFPPRHRMRDNPQHTHTATHDSQAYSLRDSLRDSDCEIPCEIKTGEPTQRCAGGNTDALRVETWAHPRSGVQQPGLMRWSLCCCAVARHCSIGHFGDVSPRQNATQVSL